MLRDLWPIFGKNAYIGKNYNQSLKLYIGLSFDQCGKMSSKYKKYQIRGNLNDRHIRMDLNAAQDAVPLNMKERKRA